LEGRGRWVGVVVDGGKEKGRRDGEGKRRKRGMRDKNAEFFCVGTT